MVVLTKTQAEYVAIWQAQGWTTVLAVNKYRVAEDDKKGWRQCAKGRIGSEYRVNAKADVWLWIEGVNSRFFFAYTTKALL